MPAALVLVLQLLMAPRPEHVQRDSDEVCLAAPCTHDSHTACAPVLSTAG